MSTLKNLLIWQKSMTLVTKTYEITQLFPKEALFGLTSQIIRCAVSIPSTIADSYPGGSYKKYHRFLTISMSPLFNIKLKSK